MRPIRLLIFGKGQIGSALSKSFFNCDLEIMSVSKSKPKLVDQPWQQIQMDIDDINGVKNLIDYFLPTKVVIAIGKSGIGECKRNPIDSYKVNVEGVSKILEMCERRNIESLLFSTSLIWDQRDNSRGSKSNQSPRTVYAQQKNLLEEMASKIGRHMTVFRLGKVIDSRTAIIEKIKKHYMQTSRPLFYQNLFMAPVHLDSVVQATEKWIAGEVKGILNLVPKYQLSESEIASEVLSRFENRLLPEYISELTLPDDELPRITFCPEYLPNASFGIYGLEAVFLETVHKNWTR
jgi:dTDP-4-dehydrorhamnose reductase